MKAGISNIYLKDIADVYYGYEDMATEMRFNGNSVIAFRVVKESKHNSFLVADRLKKQLQQLANRFNKTVDFIIQSDESKILWDNLIRLIKIAILVLMIIFAILILIFRDFKAALLIFSSVFFSVFTTFTFIYLFKIPVNLLTLSGLALGFGMFVDNAVVVFDSMARFREQGMEKREAAIIGAKTVVLPVIASSFTTIIVFFSFAFFEGRLRVYYLPLAYVIAISLLSSIVVSFVLIPTLGTRVKVRIREKKDYFKKGRILPFVFRYPLTVIVPILFLLIFSYKTFKKEVSFGQFFSFSSQEKLQVFLRFSTNVEFQDIKDAILKFEEIAMSKTYNKEVETYILAMSGNSFASMVITFPKHIENSALPLQLKQELVGVASNLAGVGVYVAGFDQEPYMYFPDSRGNLPYSVQIKGYNYEKLMEFCGQLKTYLLNNRRIKDVEIDTSKQFRGSAKKYYSLNLNKEKLKQFRITRPLNVIYIITSLMKEKTNTLKLKFDEREMSLEIKASDIEELELDDILDMNYFTEDQIPYRIRDLVNVKLTVQRGEIARENQEFVAFMRWDYMGSARAADRFHQTVYNNLTVPAGFKKSLEEKTYMMSREEEQQLFVAILISLVLIYLMLGILYENFFQPLLILLSFPLALIGVFMGYVWLDYNFDSKAYIGVILLGGIVVNNAILLIDNINRHKELCKDIVTAIVIGTKERIRPIMITTATTVLGMVPLLDFGSKTSGSSDIWSSLALCVVGGLTTSAGLILIVLPVFYYLFYKMQDYLFNK
jgi:HAE1 family hydrophobic/amphiphilic exporter-1